MHLQTECSERPNYDTNQCLQRIDEIDSVHTTSSLLLLLNNVRVTCKGRIKVSALFAASIAQALPSSTTKH